MSETTQRVLRLLDLLQSRSSWTGPELAERLGVTTRSIRRDVDRLRGLGYPVNAAQGVGGGYRLGAGRSLPPLLLHDDEAVAVAVSLRLATGDTVAGADEAAVRVLAKLDQVLPARLRGEVAAIQGATSVLGSPVEQVDAEILTRVARACRDRVRLRFGYTPRSGATRQRVTEPVRLVATGRRWYLMAWDVDRDDWRTFRLDRMADVEVSTWRFAAREHPDPVEFVSRSVTSPYPVMARVRVHAPYDEVAARVMPTSAHLTALDERSCLMEVGASDTVPLALHIGWFGFEVEVLEPPELRRTLAELGARMTRASHPPAP
ncbi:MAG: helix-turn-helix transcriptional regulator [Marmoricola sp.]